MNNMSYEYREQLMDAKQEHINILNTGLEICPCCNKAVPVARMTASVSRGIVCWDCDITLTQERV